MMIKFAFAAAMFALILPFVIASMISQLTLKKLLVLAPVLLAMMLFPVFGGFRTLERLGIWAVAKDHFVELIVSALFASLLLMICVRSWLSRHIKSLSWGRNLSQKQFEHRFVTYLRWQGWNMGNSTSIAGLPIFRCNKSEVARVFLLIATDLPYRLISESIKSNNIKRFGDIVLVYYKRPDAGIVDASRSNKWGVIYYQDLYNLDSILTSPNFNE